MFENIELHIFKNAGSYYVFDVRNFTILKVGPLDAFILMQIKNRSLKEIIAAIHHEIHHKVEKYYFKWSEWLSKDYFSTKNLSLTSLPAFNRVVIILASGCNLGCHYCFEKDVTIYNNPVLMKQKTAEDVLNWFFTNQQGPKAYIQLYGGEPLLNWDVFMFVIERAEEIASAKKVNLIKYVITNGTFLDSDKISWLNKHDVKVQVSVDGDEETHNRFRVYKNGDPSFQVIKPNIDLLCKTNIDMNIRAVLTRKNINPSHIINNLRTLGTNHVSFEVVATEIPEAKLTLGDWSVLVKNYKSYINNDELDWYKLPDELQKTITHICNRDKAFFGCGAGISELTIDPYGNIYECERMFKPPVSNIYEGKNIEQLGITFSKQVDKRSKCKDCWARYVCGGGCKHLFLTYNKKDEPFKEYCEIKKLLIEAAIIKIDKIKIKNRKKIENVFA